MSDILVFWLPLLILQDDDGLDKKCCVTSHNLKRGHGAPPRGLWGSEKSLDRKRLHAKGHKSKTRKKLYQDIKLFRFGLLPCVSFVSPDSERGVVVNRSTTSIYTEAERERGGSSESWSFFPLLCFIVTSSLSHKLINSTRQTVSISIVVWNLYRCLFCLNLYMLNPVSIHLNLSFIFFIPS